MRRTIAFLLGAGGFLAGLFLSTIWTTSSTVVISITLLAFLTLFSFWRVPFFKRLAIFGLFASYGLFYVSLWQAQMTKDVVFGKNETFVAEVVSCRSGGLARSSFRTFRCLLDAKSPYGVRLATVLDKEFTPGMRLTLAGTVTEVPPDDRLRGDGVVAMLQSPTLLSVEENPRALRAILDQLKNYSERRLQNALSEPAASLASGLLFGSRQEFSRDFLDSLRRTNTLHIIAISGFNITILTEFIRQLFSRWPRKIVFLLSSVTITLFVLMIGAPASAVRAAIMGVILLFGNLIGRKPFTPSMILLTALLMILPNPYLLRFDLGFQLSFLAFIGLIALAPLLEPRLPFFPRPLRSLLSATLGASLATAPLLIPLSGELSLVGPFVNLVILPFVPLIMLLSGIVLFLSALSLEFAQLVGLLLFLPSLLVVGTIQKAAALPFTTVPWLIGVALLFAAGALIIGLGRRHAGAP